METGAPYFKELPKKHKHHIIFIPGLGDNTFPNTNKFYTGFINRPLGFRHRDVKVHIFRPEWNTENTFNPKLERLLKVIDGLTEQGHVVSLVGQSAGGSAAINAFANRPDKINGVVIVAGRLRSGENVSPTLEKAAKKSKALEDSVLSFEKIEPNLTPEQRKRVMTITMLDDKVVPPSTVPIEEATNLYKRGGHFKGGVLGSSIFNYSKSILDFLENLRK